MRDAQPEQRDLPHGFYLPNMVIIGLIGGLLRTEEVDGAVFIVYQGLLVGMWNGQTLGERACGI